MAGSVQAFLRRLPLNHVHRITHRSLSTSSAQLRDISKYFHYNKAIVGNIPASCVDKSLRFEEPEEPINLLRARQQHANYIKELKSLVGNVIQIPVDEEYPDMVFVEDPAVVIEGRALLTRMVRPSRAGEARAMRTALERHNLEIVEMRDTGAYVDGGDVIFTGREILVGLSERTNSAGISEVARAFPNWPVTAIKVKKGVLHLKSMSSMAGIDLIAIGDSDAGRHAWRDIETKAHYKYKKLAFPDNNGANCLFINGVVLHPPKEEYPKSFAVWETLDCPRIALPNSELAKADGSLTCNSIRIHV